jgi:hypothetical protein
MSAKRIKSAARELVEALPEHSTWDDLMRAIYVRQTIEAGLADNEVGRVKSVAQVRQLLDLHE